MHRENEKNIVDLFNRMHLQEDKLIILHQRAKHRLVCHINRNKPVLSTSITYISSLTIKLINYNILRNINSISYYL